MSYPLDFIGGSINAAFATLPEAKAAAHACVDQDEKHRNRGVWFVEGAKGCGCEVPSKHIVALARRGRLIDGREAIYTVMEL